MAHWLLPSHDRALATRLKRQLMGFVSYLMYLLPLGYAVARGWVDFGYTGLAWLLLAALVVNIGFYVAIRLRLTGRFADPSLMVAQVGIASLQALVIGYYADEAKVIVLMLFFTAFFFGVFSFSRRQYLALTAAVALGYAWMLALKYAPSERGGEAFHLELLHFLILLMVLLWMSLLGSYVVRLRTHLADKQEALAAALVRLKELASHDELTGLHNRRHLMEMLKKQQERARRHKEPFSLSILDLDHFKRLNDAYGHGVGDEALREFSERMRSLLRRVDVMGRGEIDSTFGRYGGEEFLLLLPYADSNDALACVQRLRAAVHEKPFATSAGPLPVTFSAGVAQHCPGESLDALLKRADDALYRAKTAGRDRVEIAG